MKLNTQKIMIERARQGLTVQAMADKCGCSRPEMSRVLNSSRNVLPVTAGKVANALGLDVTEIILTDQQLSTTANV